MSPMLKALLASALTLPLVAFVGGVLAAPDNVDPDRSRPVIINRMDDDPSDGDTFAPTPTDEEPDGVTREPGEDGSDDDQSRGGSPGGGGLTDDRSRPAAPPPPRDLDDDEDGGDDDSNDNSNGGGSGGSRDD